MIELFSVYVLFVYVWIVLLVNLNNLDGWLIDVKSLFEIVGILMDCGGFFVVDEVFVDVVFGVSFLFYIGV